MHAIPALLWKSFRRWQQDEASLLAAAVSYYLALSLFPVLLILTSALGVFFKWTNTGNDARAYLLQVISDQMAPALSAAIEQSLAHIENFSPLSGPIGLLFLLFAALAIFIQFEQAFARIWRSSIAGTRQTAWSSAKGLFTSRLRAFVLLCGAAALLLTVFVAGIVSTTLQQRIQLDHAVRIWPFVELALQLFINALAFATLFRFLPDVKVRWRDAWRGGLFTAVVWELGLLLMTKLLIGDHYTSAYGVIGCFLAVMLWGYYAVAVIFFGAEVVQVLGESTLEKDRVLQSPTDTTVEPRQMQTTSRAGFPEASIADRLSTTLTNEMATSKAHAQGSDKPPSRLLTRNIRSRIGLPTWHNRIWQSGWIDFAVVSVLVYVSSFLALRQFNSKELAEAKNQQIKIVQFSQIPQRHQLAMALYAPLIKTLPGPYEYEALASD